jgi:uncharacterized membrane protein
MSSNDNEAGSSRLSDFEAEVAGLRIKGGSIERERQFTTLGLALAVIGIGIGVVAIILSKGAADQRDVTTYVSLSILGLSVAVVGAVLWLRYSLTHYLRYWLLRLIYEERSRD